MGWCIVILIALYKKHWFLWSASAIFPCKRLKACIFIIGPVLSDYRCRMIREVQHHIRGYRLIMHIYIVYESTSAHPGVL
ncbi:hypothetical protein F4860DRAFT_475850, partial [Xylaria cubensis]